jgi:hypothetical protein
MFVRERVPNVRIGMQLCKKQRHVIPLTHPKFKKKKIKRGLHRFLSAYALSLFRALPHFAFT